MRRGIVAVSHSHRMKINNPIISFIELIDKKAAILE